MNYGIFYRLLAFLLVIALCLAFAFALASPASAAVMPSADNLYGEWLLNERLTLANLTQEVKFTTKWDDTTYTSRYGFKLAKSGSGSWWLYYFTTESLDSKGSVYSFTDAVWTPSSSFRWIDFGDEGQVVSEDFFTWLTANATLLTPVDPEGPVIDSVILSVSTSAPYYPGTEVQLNAQVSGTNIESESPESTVYWYVHGNSSADTYIDNYGLLTIANDETASSLEVEAISTYDSTKSATISVPVSYPLNLQITPSQTTLMTSTKRQEVQFELLLPNGQPFDYTLIEWTTPGANWQYFRIDDNGFLEILPGAPAGTVVVKYAYQHDTSNVSTTSAIVTITTQQAGIYDQLTPTPEQTDKADQMEDAIGDAADKLENNNSSLGQLTPTRPQINTNLEFDQEQMLAVSPLVTNIWSINGLGRMISIVLVVATVAYIFFGKRDG